MHLIVYAFRQKLSLRRRLALVADLAQLCVDIPRTKVVAPGSDQTTLDNGSAYGRGSDLGSALVDKDVDPFVKDDGSRCRDVRQLPINCVVVEHLVSVQGGIRKLSARPNLPAPMTGMLSMVKYLLWRLIANADWPLSMYSVAPVMYPTSGPARNTMAAAITPGNPAASGRGMCIAPVVLIDLIRQSSKISGPAPWTAAAPYPSTLISVYPGRKR
jgi:hypothetical protein